MQVPRVHRTIRFTIDYPPLILAEGSRVALFPEATHEYPHADDEFAVSAEATVIATAVHPYNPEWVTSYAIRDDDGEVHRHTSFRRVLVFADHPDAY